jgi:hypothetical protein
VVVNSKSSLDLGKVFVRRNKPAEPRLFVKVVIGIPQHLLDTFVWLAFPVFNSDIEKVADVHIDVPPESSIRVVLQ